MESKQYIALAAKTESVPAELKINQTVLHASFVLAIAAGRVMDQVKRRLFYGKPLDIANLDKHLQLLIQTTNYVGAVTQNVEEGAELEQSEANQPLSQEALDAIGMDAEIAGMKLTNLNIRLLHAAIGGFTENGEKLEALLAQYEGKGLDLINYREEKGNTQWYNAIEIDEMMKLAQAGGLNPVEGAGAGGRGAGGAKQQDKEKQKDHNNQKDNETVAALNRDLANERAILEGSQKAA